MVHLIVGSAGNFALTQEILTDLAEHPTNSVGTASDNSPARSAACAAGKVYLGICPASSRGATDRASYRPARANRRAESGTKITNSSPIHSRVTVAGWVSGHAASPGADGHDHRVITPLVTIHARVLHIGGAPSTGGSQPEPRRPAPSP